MGKMVKRFASLVLCFVLSAAVFASCGAKDSKQNDNGGEDSKQIDNGAATPATTAAPNTEPAKIRIMNRVNAEVKIEDNPMLKEVEKRANVKLEYEAPPINNYIDKLQIVMASGDLPDIIYNWWGADANYEKWAKNDLLAVLDDKISEYPNLTANISKEMWELMRSVETGKIHGVARPSQVFYNGYIINQNWLDKLGLKAPDTLDEFVEVCRAFTTGDPDENGKGDTYGVSFANNALDLNSYWNAQFLTSAFNVTAALGAKDVDGNYKIREKFQGYIPFLNYVKKLYTEKILDPEFITNKIYADVQKQNQNRIGIVHGHQGNVLSTLKEVPDAVAGYTYHAPIANSKGEQTCYITPPIWGSWMISKSTKDLDACLRFLDWGNSKEGFTLFSIGVEGANYSNYDYDKRLVTRTEDQSKQLLNITSTYMTIALASGGQPAIIENGDSPERIDKYNKDLNAVLKVIKKENILQLKHPCCKISKRQILMMSRRRMKLSCDLCWVK